MQQVIDRCFAHPRVRAILLDPLASNSGAIRFYERRGFQKAGLRKFGADETMVMRLKRQNSKKIIH